MAESASASGPGAGRPALASGIQEALGQNVYLCYQCSKCTSGCPVAEFLDWQPNQVMRALQLGLEEIALHAQTPWLCACCQTCTTRCPQGLDVAGIMDFVTRAALERGIGSAVPEVEYFNQAFMREVRLWRRAYELGLTAEIKLRTRNLTRDINLGLKLFQKGKLPLLPPVARRPRPVPAAANTIAYYPGCSLHSTAVEYDRSTRAVCHDLGLKLVEPQGWNCCGSSAAHRVDTAAAHNLPLANLALVEQSGFKEMVVPCAMCFNRHRAAQYQARQQNGHSPPPTAEPAYQGTVRVSTLMQALLNHVGAQAISERVQRPLAGLRAVCYYGCLLTRPPKVTGAEHAENPDDLDRLMASLGVEVVDWSYKTTCCGAAHSLTRPEIVLKLSGNLIRHAREAGAEAIIVACPLCHTNLDARQFQLGLEAPLPVLFFTQLMAVALGLPPPAAALHKNLVDPRPLLKQKGLLDLYP